MSSEVCRLMQEPYCRGHGTIKVTGTFAPVKTTSEITEAFAEN